MTDFKGATEEEWFHFDFELGLGENLLPCVPAAEDVRVLAGSALAGKVGKIPSQFNRDGEAHGIKDWQKRPILGNEIAIWSKDRRLNLCVRTGPISGVYAIDVDIDNEKAFQVLGFAQIAMNRELDVRCRSNSKKLLIPFRLEGGSCKKRIIKTEHGRIELLADGQQFVAAGTHSSGSRYQWAPSLPDQLPSLTLEKLDALWASLQSTFGSATAAGGSATSSSNTSAASHSSDGLSSTSSAETLTEITESEWSDLLAALRFLLPHAEDNDTWSEIGYALLSLTNKPARQLFIDFSKKAPGYEPGAPEAWWEAHKSQTPRTDYRHIFSMARQRGMARVASPEAFPTVPADTAAEGGGTNGRGEHGGDGSNDDLVGSLVSDTPITPTIQLSDSRYSEIIDQLETLLIPEVFVQGPHLVRRSQAHDDGAIRRSTDALMLVMVTREWLKKRLGEIAVWAKYLKTDGAWVTTKPSDEHINGVFNLRGWTKLRPLDAISRAPFVRPDGSVCDEPGYDSRSRVLYVPGAEFPRLPADPGQREAFEALERIRGVFDQFPWKERASESAFLSHILTEAARLAIDCSPIFFYDAPAPGTGKTMLQGMAARIVHGTVPAQRAWVGDGDEIRKVLYAALLAGDRSIWFDNIPNGLKVRSPALEAFITSETWSDRKLGESSSLGIPNKMVVVGSGNNVTPTGDLARRSIIVRMDANTEHMDQRRFRIKNLKGYVMENRPQLLVDALTVIRAYHAAADAPPMPVQMASFEQWSHFCREPLIWLGLPDPVITQKNEADDGAQSIGNIFESLHAQFQSNPFTSLDVARLVSGILDTNGELAANMQTNGCAEPNNPTKVGYWLRGCRDRIASGLKLVNAGNSKVGVKWRFKRVGEELIG